MNQEEIDRILSENLKLMRGFNFLKRKVILLTAEREDREKRLKNLHTDFAVISTDFRYLQKEHKNIKEIQNHMEYENAEIKEKFKKLEEIVLTYGKEK